MLAAPVQRDQFLLAKALAVLAPSIAIPYAVFSLFAACVDLFVQQGVAPVLLAGPDVLA